MNNRIKELTDRIISDIETGSFKFSYDWKLTGEPPQNYISKHVYKGINAFLLKYFSADTYFLTFLQANEKNILIKKDSKGHKILYFKMMKKTTPGNYENSKYFPFLKHSYVFGISQTDACPAVSDIPTLPEPETVINAYSKSPTILIGDRKPCYIPMEDILHMPAPERFNSINEYYSTFFHELAHSTDLHLKRNYKDYAKEELFAELTASIICNYLNISTSFTEENTKAYLQTWLTNAKQSPKYLLDVISDAETAFRLICFNDMPVSNSDKKSEEERTDNNG